MMMLMDMPQDYATANKEQLKGQMRDSLNQQGKQGPQELTVTATKTVDVDIRGAKASFIIETGTVQQAEFVRATGAFKSKGGTGFVVVQLPKATFNEEQAEAFVRSIR